MPSLPLIHGDRFHVNSPSFVPARDDRTDTEKLKDAITAKLNAADRLVAALTA